MATNGPAGAFDDFQVPHHEGVVEGDRTESLESFSRFLHELDANLGDFHERPPCNLRRVSDAGRFSGKSARQRRCRSRLLVSVAPAVVPGGRDDRAQNTMSRCHSFHAPTGPVPQTSPAAARSTATSAPAAGCKRFQSSRPAAGTSPRRSASHQRQRRSAAVGPAGRRRTLRPWPGQPADALRRNSTVPVPRRARPPRRGRGKRPGRRRGRTARRYPTGRPPPSTRSA